MTEAVSKVPDRLLVFNGDHALEGFRKAGSPVAGELLPWREVYTEGPLPLGVTLEEFRKVRGAFLASGPAPAEVTASRLEKHEERMEEALFAMWEKGGEVMLFLDACMFDQGIFARILFLADHFRKKEGEFPLLSFACKDMIYSESSPFRELFEERERISCELLDQAGTIWESYASCLAPEKPLLEKLPFFLGKGLLRRGQENRTSSKDSLTRTERELLGLLQEGEKTPIELFVALDTLEEYPFLGDTSCWRILESLRKKALILSPVEKEIPSFTSDELEKVKLKAGACPALRLDS